MSFFSLLHVEDTSLARQQLRGLSRFSDVYRDHCLIWKVFPGEERQRDFLFRRREGHRGLSYYVVSAKAPQPVPNLFTVQTKPYEPKLTEGQWLRFELRANPTVTRKYGSASVGERRPSRRHDVLMDAKSNLSSPVATGVEAAEQAALNWLVEQGSKCGMHVESNTVLTNAYAQHRFTTKGRTIRFSSIDYCGMAEVTDAFLLQTTLLQGIGHARSFGCGLLLVQRAD